MVLARFLAAKHISNDNAGALLSKLIIYRDMAQENHEQQLDHRIGSFLLGLLHVFSQ